MKGASEEAPFLLCKSLFREYLEFRRDIYKLLRIPRYTGFWHYDVKSVKGGQRLCEKILAGKMRRAAGVKRQLSQSAPRNPLKVKDNY
jgi:hypothetical protein